MGEKHVRFRCHHSGHCCRDVICLPTPWDVIRIARETGADPRKFLEFIREGEIREVEDDDPTWIVVGGYRYLMALKRGRKGCRFLDKKSLKCKIYASRPLLCRLYPFKAQETRQGKVKGFTLHKDVGCPRHRDGKVDVAPLKKLFKQDQKHQQDYADLVAVFNRNKDHRTKPKDFLETFLEFQ